MTVSTTQPPTDLDTLLWAALEPLGYTRYGVRSEWQFYAPGTEGGYIGISRMGGRRRPPYIEVYAMIEDAPAFASGLRALADVLEAGR